MKITQTLFFRSIEDTSDVKLSTRTRDLKYFVFKGIRELNDFNNY